LGSVHPLYRHLHNTLQRYEYVDFRPLPQIDKDYAAKIPILTSRLLQVTTARLHYNFHIASVIRYCGNNNANSHLDPVAIKDKLSNIVPPAINEYVIGPYPPGAI